MYKKSKLEDVINNKVILLTGGTGSFGRKFTTILLREFKPKKLIIFSRDEYKQHEMAKVFPDGPYPIRYFLGDIRDKERLHRAFHGVDIVVHAAALKQVPALEYNPFEAVKTNIMGAENIINTAIDNGVEKVIALSTDKAANPINLYGATKLCADKLFIAGNAYSGDANTKFAVVRYGNVFNSRGSVVSSFKEQAKKGILHITNTKMTRFLVTLEQSVEFVLECLSIMQGGETFIPQLPSIKILDLAKAIGPKCKIKIIGRRPGEKINEVLLPEDEAHNSIEYRKMYIILPSFEYWDPRLVYQGHKRLADNFKYTSNNNIDWINLKRLKRILTQTNE